LNADAQSQRPNYGIDAPDVVRRFIVIGILGVVCGYIAGELAGHGRLGWMRWLVVPLWCIGITFFIQGLVMLWGSKVGKLRLRDKVIASIPWRGDEIVLDVGCGHGLMLIAAAKQLKTGKAIGVDLWQAEDQAGNSPEATQHNIRLENVAAKIELKDGDARKLEFADNTFDVILSSWALHNIYDQAGRATALREIVRVLKPGGRLVIIDIRHVPEYAKVLEESHMFEIKQSGPNFLFVIPTLTLMASKPT